MTIEHAIALLLSTMDNETASTDLDLPGGIKVPAMTLAQALSPAVKPSEDRERDVLIEVASLCSKLASQAS